MISRKIENEYFRKLSENEFMKYERSLEKAKEGFYEDNVAKIEFWLTVARHALSQSATYKKRIDRRCKYEV